MKTQRLAVWLVGVFVLFSCTTGGSVQSLVEGEPEPDNGIGVADVFDEDIIAMNDVAIDGPPSGELKPGYDLYIFDTDSVEVEPLELFSLDPPKGKTIGGEQVVLTGSGFEDGMAVFFGFQEAPAGQIWVAGTKKATITTPAGFPGPVDVTVVTSKGQATLENGFLYFNPVQIISVDPAAGPTQGGVPIVVTGSGFFGDAQLIIGDKIAIDTQIMDDETLLAVTPPGTTGFANVSVSADEGLATLLDGFFYYEYPEIQEINPAAGSASGGSVVQIVMTGAHEEAQVYFGEEPVSSVAFVDYNLLQVVTPPAEVGYVDVTITTPYGSSTRQDGFFYYGGALPPQDLQIISVQPDSGPTSGGNKVQISAFGLTDPADSTVLFGNKVADVEAVVPGLMLLTVIAPVGAEGAVDVTVMNSNGTAIKDGAYTYLPMATLFAVTPDHGPTIGGTNIAISGAGFIEGAQVLLGALPAYDVMVVSEDKLTARSPMGSPGAVDVHVLQGGTTATLEDGFTYEGALDLFVVNPNFGSISGGTLITLVGSGFAEDASVRVAGVPCSHVTFHSYNVVTAKTPPGVPGTFDIEMTVSGKTVMLPLSYTYFDPVSFYGGTWGGLINHSVNVTVLDSGSGQPLPDAFVMLWADPDTPYQGMTNINGQVTFSGPDVLGDQMVTASKECYSNSSVVEYNATNVTLYIGNVCPSSGGGMGPPGTVAVINGRVTGLGKYVVIPPGNCNYNSPAFPFLCQACSGDIECGAPENACVNLGDQGKKCLTACMTEDECPLGFSCTSVQGGSDFGHCLPLGGEKMTFCSTTKGHFLGANASNGPGMIADGDGYFSLMIEYPPTETAVVCLGGVLPVCNGDYDCTFGDSVCFENGCWMSDGRPEMTPYAMGVKRHIALSDTDGDYYIEVNDVLIELDVPMNRKINVFFDEPHLNWNGPNAIYSKTFVEFGSDGVFEFLEFPVKYYWDDDTTLTFQHLPNGLTGSLANTTFAVFGASVTAAENAAAMPKTFALMTDLLDFENDAMLIKGSDGWAVHASGVKQNLYDLWGPSWTDVYGVGMDGAIAHFNGYSWQIQQTPVDATLRGVHGADGLVWGVGDGGSVVRFNGTIWEEVDYPKTKNLRGVWSSASTFVVVVGEYVVDFFDGDVWSSMPGSTGHRFEAVYGVNSQNIWAVGEYGKIIRYQNGTWQTQPGPTSNTLRDVWASSPSNVWAVGDSGTVIHYDGSEWTVVESGTLNKLNSIYGLAEDDIYVVGNKGVVLHFSGLELVNESLGEVEQDLLAIFGSAESGLLLASGNHQVVLGPFVSPVTIVYPEEGAVIDQKYLQWQAGPGGPDASFNSVLLQQPSMMGPVTFWDFMADGDVTYVDLPDFPNIEGTPGVPAGFYIYTIQRVYKEGFDIDNFDFTDLDYRSWRSWSQVQQTFVGE
jgi:hypothetical protein